jgi:hypothetical protein
VTLPDAGSTPTSLPKPPAFAAAAAEGDRARTAPPATPRRTVVFEDVLDVPDFLQ